MTSPDPDENPYRLLVHADNPDCWGHEAGAFPETCPDG